MDIATQERHSWIKFAIIITWLTLIASLSAAGGSSSTPRINFDDPKMVIVAYVSQIAGVLFLFILPALLIAGLWTSKGVKYTGLFTPASGLTLLLSTAGILAAQPLINWMASLNEQMHLPAALHELEEWMKRSEEMAGKMSELFTRSSTVGGLLLNLFVVAFMAALSEELFFRGLLQKVATECFRNKHIGVWFTAICFSAIHLQFFGFFPRMLMGVYLGYLFVWSGSLWPSMIAHFINNGMAVFLLWLAKRGMLSADVDKIGSESNQFIYVALSMAITAFMMLLIARFEKKRSQKALA
jgi:membrane protease YdiL (CAAX protease family)